MTEEEASQKAVAALDRADKRAPWEELSSHEIYRHIYDELKREFETK